jgi:hypothetical protein
MNQPNNITPQQPAAPTSEVPSPSSEASNSTPATPPPASEENYDDIINLPRPASYFQPMPMLSRAAQFAPFAALSGHDEAIKATARRHNRDEQ